VEEWITLLASDPVVKGNEFLFIAYNKIKFQAGQPTPARVSSQLAAVQTLQV
jgi:hypothetical protein